MRWLWPGRGGCGDGCLPALELGLQADVFSTRGGEGGGFFASLSFFEGHGLLGLGFLEGGGFALFFDGDGFGHLVLGPGRALIVVFIVVHEGGFRTGGVGGLEVAFLDATLADVVVRAGVALEVIIGVGPEVVFPGVGQLNL